MLMTFGCSFVWGDELKGHDDYPCSHWNKTFSKKLGKKLGVETQIVAQMGSSNDKIFRDVITHLHKSDETPTHMVVVWSHPNRCEAAINVGFDPELLKIGFRKDKEGKRHKWNVRFQQNMHQFGPSRPEWLSDRKVNVVNNYYHELWNEHTAILDLLTKMQTLELVCKGNNIKLIQCQYAEFTRQMLSDCMDAKRFQHMKPWRNHINVILSNLHKQSKVGLHFDDYGFDMNTRAKEKEQVLRYGHPSATVHTWYANKLKDIFEEEDRWKTYFQPQKRAP